MGRLIMVVERAALFRDRSFTGFCPAEEADFESLVLANFTTMERALAEEDARYKQPIGYTIVVNPHRRLVFAYQRASQQGRYDEARLRGKWSWGVGGHIEPGDAALGNPLRRSVERELREEVAVPGDLAPRVLGYINDEATEVGRVHFGILYVAETDATEARPLDPEIARGGFRPIDDLEAILADPACAVEEWSRIAFPPLASRLGR